MDKINGEPFKIDRENMKIDYVNKGNGEIRKAGSNDNDISIWLSDSRNSINSDISGELDVNGDGIITQEELDKYLLFTEDTEDTEETKGRDKDGNANFNTIKDMTKEDVADMTGEELAKLLHDGLAKEFTDNMKNHNGGFNMNDIMQNAMLFTLVDKMSNEQLSDFMEAYQKMYPNAKQGNRIDFFNFDAIAKGTLWGNYSIQSGLIDEDTAIAALERLKAFITDLTPDINGNVGVKQWL